jgi:hypothetical protein
MPDRGERTLNAVIMLHKAGGVNGVVWDISTNSHDRQERARAS